MRDTDDALASLLDELERTGLRHDAETDDKASKMLNITRDTGEFLAVLIAAARARTILEIGTSNGYSTIWLASAAGEGGSVVTIEKSRDKLRLAEENFALAGMAGRIRPVLGDAGDALRSLTGQFDLVFLDADRSRYRSLADSIVAAVRPGGLLVCDNAVSHADELREFVDFVDGLGLFKCCLVPVGKGEFVACRVD